MSKFISRTKFVIFILIVIQLIAIAAFCGFYFTNFNSFKDYIKDWYLILGACGLVFIDCLFIWIVFIRLAAIRQKTDLSAAEIIGGDIQEAYNFAMLGLVVTDENDIVMWTNDLFKDRQIDIIDRNIFEWKKELNELRNNASDQSITILVNQRNYSVKYLPEAGLWIFKDVDEHFKLYQQYNDQAPVLGLLTIDNYDELFRGEEDYNDTLTKVKSIIYSYAKDYGVLLRRFKDENYSMYCNYDSLVKMREDNFSLIDKVRQESSKEDMPLTLSIGIAHNLHDIIRLNELAKSAQDIAMARGGDQVVITKFGGEMEFIGGKTEAQEKRNRVKIRTLGDTLIGLIRNNKTSNVLVMGHVGMDMDALGACLGIKAICDFYNKKCQVVVDFKKIENKCRAAINSLFSKDELDELCIGINDAMSILTPDTLVFALDVNRLKIVMSPEIIEKASKICVIDHHIKSGEDDINGTVFNQIDTSASSTSEMISEFIQFAGTTPKVKMSAKYATIMLSGIFLDSSFFKSKKTGIRTFEAATYLKECGADNTLADDLLKDDYEEYVEVNSLVRKFKSHSYGVVYAYGEPDKIYDQATLAKAANTCLSMKGVHCSFVFAKITNKEIGMSCRSDGSYNVSIIAEKLGGGGHFDSAGVKFNRYDIPSVEEALKEVLDRYLPDAKADPNKMKGDEE